MLGLRHEVGGNEGEVGGCVGEHESFRGAGREVDADLSRELDLRRGHPCAPGPTMRSTGSSSIREAEGHRADRLGTAGDEQGIDAQQAGGAEQHGVDAPSRPAGDATTIRSTPATWAGTTAISSDEG